MSEPINLLQTPVSVVIPNYNGRVLMEKHLPAVFAMLRDGDEVIVVDDCSTDDSIAWLLKLGKLSELNPEQEQVGYTIYFLHITDSQKIIDLKVLRNHQNLRFARNCNRGVSVAQHPYVFLLNTDVEPHHDVLQYLLPCFEDRNVFAVGCLEHEDQNGQIIHSGKNTLTFMRGLFIHARASEFSSGETAWVSGGSGLFDRQKWSQIGGFDERYSPAYWEDIDLSFQAKIRGWKVLFEEKAEVDHNHETTNKDAFGQQKIIEISWRNAAKFVWKNATVAQKMQFLIWQPYWWLQRSKS
jgi:GT2 family glycosyltransferase